MAEDRDFSEQVARVARELLAEPDVQHTLQRAVDLAAEHLAGKVYASVSIVYPRRRVETPAASDDRAVRADQLQYELGDGPCLDAIWQHDTFQIDDLATDERYRQWSRRTAEETGIRSSISFQLVTSGDSLGALNIYSPEVGAFSADDRADGQMFAAQAAIALQSAQTEEGLRAALESRNLIGQAQGILMERYKITSGRAFEVLRRISQDTNVKVTQVAKRLIETGDTSTDGGIAAEPPDRH
jgi:GAF domain-containing protein